MLRVNRTVSLIVRGPPAAEPRLHLPGEKAAHSTNLLI